MSRHCRDCADNFGTCPYSGTPCDPGTPKRWSEFKPAQQDPDWDAIRNACGWNGTLPAPAAQGDERAAFEAWGLSQHYEVGHKSQDGTYIGQATAIAWEAWQARAALSRQPSEEELEQARLLGMSAEREARHLARIAELERDLSRQPSAGDVEDAKRYRELRRGQKFSVVDGLGDTLWAESLDSAVDAARAQRAAEQGDNHGTR